MPDDPDPRVIDATLADAISERYLAYALSTITARSLPDVRDGLKPVHRRLLWAMHQLRLDPAAGFKKCARIVGDVMGKYHPHGDAAIYDAMVRLAQDFAARYPLVEGQGNFGNIDGDNAAAMRYTEARLTAVAGAMLAGIEDDAVDFRATYDGEEREPLVLPAAFPNLLANGATGIAVGMATAIPPHNAGELLAAALHLVRHPDANTGDLLAFVQGPDFPTGGVLVEPPDAIRAAYETGRGGFRLRARWEREDAKGGAWRILVTEIPYGVPKAKLIEAVAALMEAKKLPLLADIRDESTDRVRLVLEPRSRTVDPGVLMETLFRASALETRVPLNMNVLDAQRTPRVMSLRDVLRAWLDHREVVLRRRTAHRLAAIARRLELLDGFLIAYLNLDEVIRIVREEDDARVGLMRAFPLSEVQADAILNMRLRSLRRLEEMEIRREHKTLSAEQKGLNALLATEAKRWAAIATELEAAQKQFAGGALGTRRTETGQVLPVVLVDEAAFVAREPITVILSERGWIRAQKGHLPADAELRFKEGDALAWALHAETTDRLLLFASNGRAYTLRAEDVSRGRGDGQPMRLLLDLGQDDTVVALRVLREGDRWLVAASDGRGFVVAAEDLLAERRTGKTILTLAAGAVARVCVPATGDTVAVVGENRKLLVFPLDQVPVLARGTGVRLQAYRDGGLSDARVFAATEGLSWSLGERERREMDLQPWQGTRASAGRAPPNGFPKHNRFA